MRVVLSGGGTGGHIYPALSIAEAFRAERPEAGLLFIGSSHGMEGGLAERAGLDFVGIPSGPLGKAISIRNLSSLSKLVLGVGRAHAVLRKFKPDVVISTGGYTSAGVVVAQRVRGGKIIVHEQNAVPGRTNLGLSRIANRVCVTFEESASYFPAGKTVHTGMPMAESAVRGMDKAEAARQLGLDPDVFTVLVTGGSQGAQKLNRLMVEAVPLLEDIQVIHQLGDRNFKEFEPRFRELGERYRPVAYIHDIYRAYSAADLVVCRAGAATIGDFTTAGRPAVLIPYPFAYADHQRKNAECVAKSGAGMVVEESELTASVLSALILDLKQDSDRLEKMAAASAAMARPNAAKDIVRLALALAERDGKG